VSIGLIVSTGVIVAPTAGENVFYQYQINGITAVKSNGFAPRMWLGALLFSDGFGTPDVRLVQGVIWEVRPQVPLTPLEGTVYPEFPGASSLTLYPDVSLGTQVLSTGEITLGMNNGGGSDGWCNLVLTVSPEMILPPGFFPLVLE